jgi:hydrogenase maturation protein HypF
MRCLLLKSAARARFNPESLPAQTVSPKVRLKLSIRGAVQGVGFRPFIFRLAEELKISGWVSNSPQGVLIEVEGPKAVLEKFLLCLANEKPPHSSIQSLEPSWLDAVGHKKFEIRESETAGVKNALVLPDIATCPDCLREIFDPQNRRYRYPFTNCTHCGPRFSIIEALPYDRANTSMKQFTMCPACQREYDDPRDRRFHAQPNACPVCGPRLALWNAEGEAIFGGDKALRAAAQMIRRGKIVAVKSIGGFHLMADARNEQTIALLRQRKHREEKPLAVMFSTISAVKLHCEVSALEERLLRSPEAPIVLLRKIGNRKSEIGNEVAPENPNLGALLPSNPLQHLLLLDLDFPVVATSGNLSDEPICTDEREALERLRGIADFFLVHDRPIVRHVDDSIVRVVLDREMVLRRARGFAPLPVELNHQLSAINHQPILAVGAHLKNSVALAVGQNVFISQHIGDLETEAANRAFRQVATDLPKLYATPPQIVIADLHPDYASTKFANEFEAKQHIGVQHHIAHVLSCLAENEVALPALGVAWDGIGYGTDGTIWGGEFFVVTKKNVERVAHLRPFRLPGGDRAVKEPRRVALGLLYELYGEAAFEMGHLAPLRAIPPVEMITLRGMLQRKFNSPLTSSVGRLFDAVASLTNLSHHVRFEGQAAMLLEFAADKIQTNEAYQMRVTAREGNRPIVLDWAPMIGATLADVRNGVLPELISAKFHNALVEVVVAMAKQFGEKRVVISGGCFQNRYLTERVVSRLRAEDFSLYWHQRVPTNDGGIALGQIAAALRESKSPIADTKS